MRLAVVHLCRCVRICSHRISLRVHLIPASTQQRRDSGIRRPFGIQASKGRFVYSTDGIAGKDRFERFTLPSAQ